MSLLNSQKNQLYGLIEAAGFSPAQFTFEPVPSRFEAVPIATRLTYKGTQYGFLFERKGRRDLHFVMYSPGLHNLEDVAQPGADWVLVVAYFKEWLQNLRRELGEGDKWETLAVTLANTSARFTEDPNSPKDAFFTVGEYENVVARLNAAEERLPETDLTEEQIEVIKLRFERVKEMGRTLKRGDWEALFVGSIVGTLGQLGVTPGTARMVWDILKEVFGKLLT